jgi:hypothetical protein
MSEYKTIHNDIKMVLDDCEQMSKKYAEIPSPTSAHFYASLIFTKLCVSSMTALSICPPPKKLGRDALWDCASVASLTRGIIETYLLLFYLCIEKCDKTEWEGRWKLMNLHDHMSRLKMFKVAENSDEQVVQFEGYTDEVKSDLKNTDYFKTLDEKQKKHFLKGNTAFFKSQDEIVKASGGSVDEFRFRYRFLSNHTHSYPMGFYRMAENGRGTGVESTSEVAYSGMCLSWIAEYLTIAKNDFEALWAPHKDLVSV